MAVTEESEAQVRELREKAEEYADRVRAGEEPWKDEEGDVSEEVDDPRDDDVGETGESDDAPVEVGDDVADAPAVEQE